MLSESANISPLDAQIMRGLQLSPRVPFSALAAVLDVSEQTVARRYRRLVREGFLRVTAVLDPVALGQSDWIVRTRCKPSGATAVAQALAQRDDVSWVFLMSGGSEIAWVLRARSSEDRDDLLTQRLPRSAPVLDISAAMVLNRFIGGGLRGRADWSGLRGVLTAEQEDAVETHDDLATSSEITRVELDRDDVSMLAVLAADGRATMASVAASAGTSEARATRRVRTLFAAGAVYLDVDLSADTLGFETMANLWLTVAPAHLDRAGRQLATAAEVPFAAAVTGPQNITATVLCRDARHLYTFITQTVGAIEGIQAVEVTPRLRTLKQAGVLTDGDRLGEPVSARRSPSAT